MNSAKSNILVAFPYLNQGILDRIYERKDDVRFLIDSGAFTAWKAKKSIDLDDYCRLIERLPFKPFGYFTLDVIGDAKASMTNYELMLKRGFNPIPIFTRGEDPSVLEDYYKTSEIVGIGGLVGTQGNRGFINGVMKHIKGRKCHWLGFTAMPFLKAYRPFMCDSSSWSMGTRFGTIYLYKGLGEFLPVKQKAFHGEPTAQIKDLILRHGLSLTDFQKKEHWRNVGVNKVIQVAGVRAWTMCALEVERNLKTKMFLAGGSVNDVAWFLDAFDWFNKRGSV